MDAKLMLAGWDTMKTGTVMSRYLSAKTGSPREVAALDAWFQDPTKPLPVLTSAFGSGLVDVLRGISAPAPVPVPPQPQPGAVEFGVSLPGDQILYQTPAQQDEELADIVALGAKWVRTDFRWSALSTQSFSVVGPFIDRVHAHGLKLLPIYGVSFPGGMGPGNVTEWRAFCKTTGQELQARGVDPAEIWNEQNGGFWPGTVAQYTAFLVSAYEEIHGVNQNAQVLVGGFVPQGGDYTYPASEVQWMKGIYANGGKGHFEAVACHPYIGGGHSATEDIQWSGWYKMARAPWSVRSVMDANGDVNKDIWVTEYGNHLSGYLPDANEDQVKQLIQIAVATWRSYSWAGPFFYYTDRDDGSTGGYGLSERTYPLQHRPRWDAYKAAIA